MEGLSLICWKIGVSIAFPLANKIGWPILASPLRAHVLHHGLGVFYQYAGQCSRYDCVQNHWGPELGTWGSRILPNFQWICEISKKQTLFFWTSETWGHLLPHHNGAHPEKSEEAACSFTYATRTADTPPIQLQNLFSFTLSPSLLIILFILNNEFILLEDRF